ncbi:MULTISPECIES: potassium channel family protein [unclassified Yoonia]|uniref:potassium channel family protein n=1 Tax=unclassified Yoonia TaxID=2629118 RepID=UPI002AFDE9CA|nr:MULTISPECIES: ion channel [unclassified Yoonia]
MAKQRFDGRLAPLREKLHRLYHGRTETSLRFRLALLVFDLAIIGSYVVTSVFGIENDVPVLDLLLALIVLADLVARWLIAPNARDFILRTPLNWADIVVILSLLAPLLFGDFAFFRVLRALRVVRSYRVLQELRDDSRFFRRNEEVIQRSVNLTVFIFIVSSVVHASQRLINPDITTWVDALYFTMAALTTTGFGDIVLVGTSGRWLSIAILIVGVGLFLHLLQSVFQPTKVREKCKNCGLLLHDIDAIHCKHCGAEMNIETEGL